MSNLTKINIYAAVCGLAIIIGGTLASGGLKVGGGFAAYLGCIGMIDVLIRRNKLNLNA